MFRRAAFGAVAALTVSVLAAGCGEDGDTIISGSSSNLRPGNFPGSQVDAANLAEDGRAFSTRGQDVTTGAPAPEIYWNVTTGEAILLFQAVNNIAGGTSESILYAAYFSGTTWSAPVPLRGRNGNTNEDPASAINGYKVLWLNTTGSTNTNALNRNGDAIILATRNDLAPAAGVGTTEEDSNRRVWFYYFDRTGLGSTTISATEGPFVNGFMTEGKVVDDDNVVTGAANDPSVSSFGFVSSSLSKTHAFTAGVDAVDSGEVTNEVLLVYLKAQSSGATAVGTRYKSVVFDLTGATNVPTAGGAVQAPAQTGLDNADNADAGFVVHNNVMFWRVPAVGTTPDDVVSATVFSGGTGTAITVGSLHVATSTDSTAMVDESDVYGNDHGCSSIYAFTTESGFQGAGAVGARASQSTLILRKLDIDQTTGAITADGTEPARIDEFRAATITATSAGTEAPVNATFQTRMNRPGRLIFVIYGQNNSVLTAGVRNLIAKGVVVQTRRDATARSLATSFSSSVNAAQVQATGAQAQSDIVIGTLQFQQDLATGHAHSQGGLALGCVFQSNPNRANFTFTQRGEQPTAGTSEDLVLLLDGLLATPDVAAAPVAPTLANVNGTTRTEIVRADQVDDAGGLGAASGAETISDVIAVDMGDDTSTTAGTVVTFNASAGRVNVFYGANGNTVDNLDATNAFVERRLFVYEQNTNNTSGTSTSLSSNPAAGNTQDFHQLVNNSARVIQVETNLDVVQSPGHRGTTQHVFFLENASRGANNRLATRSYLKTATTATNPAVVFSDRWTPTLATLTPTYIDSTDNGAITAAPTLVRNGQTVGVLFQESGHLFYQQTAGTAALTNYFTALSLPNPELVDNESVVEIGGRLTKSPPRCDNLSKTQVGYLKQLDPSNAAGNDLRLMIRVLD